MVGVDLTLILNQSQPSVSVWWVPSDVRRSDAPKGLNEKINFDLIKLDLFGTTRRRNRSI